MILTGIQIKKEIALGNIVIQPFSDSQINPNSYNYRLGTELKVFTGFDGLKSLFKKIKIPENGYELEAGKMYLATTKEIIGSDVYAMSLIGRSSVGRCGMFLQVSANLGQTFSCHKWTLEIVALKPVRIYPDMLIGQVSFWKNFGNIEKYKGKYGFLNNPQEFIN